MCWCRSSSWIVDPGWRNLHPGSSLLEPGSWILTPRSWIQESGSRHLEQNAVFVLVPSFAEPPTTSAMFSLQLGWRGTVDVGDRSCTSEFCFQNKTEVLSLSHLCLPHKPCWQKCVQLPRVTLSLSRTSTADPVTRLVTWLI